MHAKFAFESGIIDKQINERMQEGIASGSIAWSWTFTQNHQRFRFKRRKLKILCSSYAYLRIAPVLGWRGYAPPTQWPSQHFLPAAVWCFRCATSEELEDEEMEEPPLLTLYKLSEAGTDESREVIEYPEMEEGNMGRPFCEESYVFYFFRLE